MKRVLTALMSLFIFSACSSADFEDDLKKAESLVSSGKYKKAIEIYDSIVDDNPNDRRSAAVLFLKAKICENSLNDSAAAINAYNEILKKFPDSQITTRSRLNLASLYLRDEKWEDAIVQYEGLLRLDPENDSIRLKLAESYISAGNLLQGRIELGPILNNMNKLDKDIAARALFDYGESFMLEQRYEDAAVQYKLLIDVYPKSQLMGESIVKIATCYELEGYIDAALSWFVKAKAYFPDSSFIKGRIEHLKTRGKRGKEPK